MREIELKLQVPEAARAGVERDLLRGAAQRVHLQAIYFDTADRRLAAAGMALRLRKEGRRWVQTLKSGSAHGLERAEHEVVLPAAQGKEPVLDVARHADTAPGARLQAVLSADAHGVTPALLPLYRTDVWRRQRLLRARLGTVELAYDRGVITGTGPDGVMRCWPVCELEVELQRGDPRAVTEVAGRWAQRHGLWPDSRSKAERGERLSRGLGPGDPVPVTKSAPLGWRKAMTPTEAGQALLDNLLAHALPNWSEVAGGSSSPEAVHQLRVALRRLRSAERFVAGWLDWPTNEWSAAAASLFDRLGAVRDRDVLASGLLAEVDAALAAIDAPALALHAAGDPPAWTEADSARHGGLFIALLAAQLPPPNLASAIPANTSSGAPPALRRLVAARLADWHRRLRRDAKQFLTLDDAGRHRVRKRAKRLRYAVEFAAALFPRAAVASYLAPLCEAQDRLGAFNDVCVAQQACGPLTEREPRAWFALGWLSVRREQALAEAAEALARWRRASPFWR